MGGYSIRDGRQLPRKTSDASSFHPFNGANYNKNQVGLIIEFFISVRGQFTVRWDPEPRPLVERWEGQLPICPKIWQ